ncbi:MAG TPA: VCBS repeat-containing protein [Bryobacteraceae bacterium]|nr:VCBS repeat-containing protein [Bryobacteraceae bacterium]
MARVGFLFVGILSGLAFVCSLPAQPVRLVRHEIVSTRTAAIKGAVLDLRKPGAPVLLTWGHGVDAHALLTGPNRAILASGGASFREGGCLFDIDGDSDPELVLLEAGGDLVWIRQNGSVRGVIDTGVDSRDVVPATLHGRRGILLVQKQAQVRFYEIPKNVRDKWPYREIYSFYTPSRQAGLRLDDVDGDGLPDILCGNYWIRSPASFDLPWRLFAINTWSETPDSAMLRLALADVAGRGSRQLIAAQAEVPAARLAWFEKPPDPTQLWAEHRVGGVAGLRFLQGLDAADFDGDGLVDLAASENAGKRSLLFLLHNLGGGSFSTQRIASNCPVFYLRATDVNGDTKPDLVTVGPGGAAWWENRTHLRK